MSSSLRREPGGIIKQDAILGRISRRRSGLRAAGDLLFDSWGMYLQGAPRFPYPVASAYARAEAARDHAERHLDHLLFVAESLLQLVGTIVLIDAGEALKAAPAGGRLRAEFDR